MEADPVAWSELAAAIVVASVAFAGFIVVALSINVDGILALGGVPQVALQGLVMLTALSISAILLLVPGTSTSVLGAELLVLGLVLMLTIGLLALRAYRQSPPHLQIHRISGGVLLGLPGLMMCLAGVSLLAGGGGGLYWLVPAWVVGIVAGVLNAWVLLVEVKR